MTSSTGSRRGGLLAVELIGPFKSRKVFPALLAALQEDADPRIREGAAQALGRLGIKARKDAAFKLGLTGVREGLIVALRRDKVGGCPASRGRGPRPDLPGR